MISILIIVSNGPCHFVPTFLYLFLSGENVRDCRGVERIDVVRQLAVVFVNHVPLQQA